MAEDRWALIGDSNSNRFDLLQKILDDHFATKALRVQNYEELRDRLNSRKWNLILLAYDLPETPAVRVSRLVEFFNHLRFEAYNITQGCIVGSSEPIELQMLDPPPQRIHIPTATLSQTQVQRVIAELGTILPAAPNLPEVKLVRSLSLYEQVRLLSDNRNLEDGKKVLAHLIRNPFKCEQAGIAQLSQGLSGSQVFRVTPVEEGDEKEFILKVSPILDSWKIELEVERYEKAKKTLGVEGYIIHFPLLIGIRSDRESNSRKQTQVIYHDQWCAIFYDFLGEKKLGKFIDLATVLIGSSEELQRKCVGTPFEHFTTLAELRLQLFTTTLEWLCKTWYMASTIPVRGDRKIWETRDTPPKKYPALPPYRLSRKSKGYVLAFLDSERAKLGENLIPGWENCRKQISNFLGRGRTTGIKALDAKRSVRLSPAHGDLNANNVLIWLDRLEHPFLIDFPFYQVAGHALQDFARLEVEIIFSLLDRQLDSAVHDLVAQDYTFSQLPIWLEMEDHLLLNWNKPKRDWTAKGFVDNANFSLKLIQVLRSKAAEVQQQGVTASTPSFFEEYAPALLYHTIKAIGYDSLPIFKRLLAVYSASKLLEQIKA